MKTLLPFGVCVIVVLLALVQGGSAQTTKVPQTAWEKAKKENVVRVIVTLTVEEIPEGKLTREARDSQRQAIAAGQDALIAELKGTKYRVLAKGRTGNFIGLEVGEDALSVLERSSLVKKVDVDRFDKFSQSESISVVRAPQVWDLGYDGSGWAIDDCIRSRRIDSGTKPGQGSPPPGFFIAQQLISFNLWRKKPKTTDRKRT